MIRNLYVNKTHTQKNIKYKASSNYNECHKTQCSMKIEQASDHILCGRQFLEILELTEKCSIWLRIQAFEMSTIMRNGCE